MKALIEISFIQNPHTTHSKFVDIFTIEKISKDQADGRELSLFIHNLLQPQSGLPASCTLGRDSKAGRGGEISVVGREGQGQHIWSCWPGGAVQVSCYGCSGQMCFV